MKILIIDDSSTTRNFIVKELIKHGYHVSEAIDGMDGLIKIEGDKPDVIILDLLMPKMDGFEVLEVLQEKSIAIPVIVLSADIQLLFIHK